jgi:hypothetical protein
VYRQVYVVDSTEGAEIHNDLFHFSEQRMFLLFCSNSGKGAMRPRPIAPGKAVN